MRSVAACALHSAGLGFAGSRPVEPRAFQRFHAVLDVAGAREVLPRRLRAFVDILERSLAEAGRDWNSIRTCLEVGCGYGRIVRELRDRLPASRIFVTDVIEEGARFTAAELGATRIPLIEQAAESMRDRFDMTYLLSVHTHLRRDLVETTRSRRDRAQARRRPDLHAHGWHSAETAERYEQYWLDKRAVLDGLARDGYYYERYPYYYDEYGLTWFTQPAMIDLVARVAPDLEFVAHHEAAVDAPGPVRLPRAADLRPSTSAPQKPMRIMLVARACRTARRR